MWQWRLHAVRLCRRPGEDLRVGANSGGGVLRIRRRTRKRPRSSDVLQCDRCGGSAGILCAYHCPTARGLPVSSKKESVMLDGPDAFSRMN